MFVRNHLKARTKNASSLRWEEMEHPKCAEALELELLGPGLGLKPREEREVRSVRSETLIDVDADADVEEGPGAEEGSDGGDRPVVV